MHGDTHLVSLPWPLCPSDDYKEFGVNCEKMASEIEDHILCGGWGFPGTVCCDTHSCGVRRGDGDKDRG